MGNDLTVERLGDSGIPSGSELEAISAPKLKVCPNCRQRYSGDTRFCPFDGGKLELSVTYSPTSDPLSGSMIDQRYVVLNLLGEGGMGTVYRVRHRALGRFFALKALKADLARDRALSARFIQEAKAAAAVSHPNVVQITDFGSLPTGQPYFVMELLQGTSLCRAIASDGPFEPRRTVHIARQVAEALGAAHRVGIIHRDLKPDNIHLGSSSTGRGSVKVLDFGLAKIAGGSSLTRSGMVFGTPHYMSPEQASGEPVDHRADIYALGVVMYEMLAGRVPFESDTYMGVLTKHMYVDPPRPSDVAGREQHAELEDIVLRCMSKDPGARFESMAALIRELDRVFPGTRTGSVPTPATAIESSVSATERDRRRGKHRFWVWVAAALALGGLVALAARAAGWAGSDPAPAPTPPPSEQQDDVALPVTPADVVSAGDRASAEPAASDPEGPASAEATDSDNEEPSASGRGLVSGSRDAARSTRPSRPAGARSTTPRTSVASQGSSGSTAVAVPAPTVPNPITAPAPVAAPTPTPPPANAGPSSGTASSDTTGEIIDPWANK